MKALEASAIIKEAAAAKKSNIQFIKYVDLFLIDLLMLYLK